MVKKKIGFVELRTLFAAMDDDEKSGFVHWLVHDWVPDNLRTFAARILLARIRHLEAVNLALEKALEGAGNRMARAQARKFLDSHYGKTHGQHAMDSGRTRGAVARQYARAKHTLSGAVTVFGPPDETAAASVTDPLLQKLLAGCPTLIHFEHPLISNSDKRPTSKSKKAKKQR
jgi:hypothetical protein